MWMMFSYSRKYNISSFSFQDTLERSSRNLIHVLYIPGVIPEGERGELFFRKAHFRRKIKNNIFSFRKIRSEFFVISHFYLNKYQLGKIRDLTEFFFDQLERLAVLKIFEKNQSSGIRCKILISPMNNRLIIFHKFDRPAIDLYIIFYP